MQPIRLRKLPGYTEDQLHKFEKRNNIKLPRTIRNHLLVTRTIIRDGHLGSIDLFKENSMEDASLDKLYNIRQEFLDFRLFEILKHNMIVITHLQRLTFEEKYGTRPAKIKPRHKRINIDLIHFGCGEKDVLIFSQKTNTWEIFTCYYVNDTWYGEAIAIPDSMDDYEKIKLDRS